tara:strand:- start:346 stop:1302 length:957 start_codon:yes stop_codon:yes gene_type:complete
MKILIVGGAGFIGSHMVKYAHNAGHDVITVDNLSTGFRDAVLYGKFEFCDLLDVETLSNIFNKYKPEAVMHFGGHSLVSESINNPYKYYCNNVQGTLNLLKVMRDNKCNKLIFSSSAAVYGNPKYLPIDEKHIKNPINPYGRSKLMVENILKDFEQAHGLRYVSFRYFNAAGQDPEGDLKERHQPETHLIPILMQASRGEREGVDIYGTDYDTKDGTAIRDYIHVCDLADAHLRGLDYLSNVNNKSTEFNLGNENGYSVKEVIERIKILTKSNFKVTEKERRFGDPSVLVASSKKAKNELGFNPKFSDLDVIIKSLNE